MPDAAATFEEHLAREIIHSERMRMAILAGLLGVLIVFFGLLYALLREDYQQIFSRPKAFNQTGWENMSDPTAFKDGKPVMFVAGDDADARRIVLDLANGLGFEAIDAGALAMSRYLEPLAMLWILLANAEGLGMRFALSVIHR